MIKSRDRMNIVKKAIENNEMLQLLEGKNGYSIQNDSFASISAPIDWTVVIPMIYEEYSNTANKDIVEMYVTAIKDMLAGDAEDVFCGISVLYFQIMREEKERSPFEVDRTCLIKMASDAISKNGEALKLTKKWSGTNQPEGLFSEILRYKRMLRTKYGIEG